MAADRHFDYKPLKDQFPRLGGTNYLSDSVHLHMVHYRTMWAALEEEATVAALTDHFPRLGGTTTRTGLPRN